MSACLTPLAASQVRKFAIDFDQPVVGAAGNPQQMDLLIGFGNPARGIPCRTQA